MRRPQTRRELVATESDIARAESIVREQLGAGYAVDYTSLTKNVGVMGDEGVLGHTALIYSVGGSIEEAYNSCDLDELTGAVIGRTLGVSRVLIDITPNIPPGLPFVEVDPFD